MFLLHGFIDLLIYTNTFSLKTGF